MKTHKSLIEYQSLTTVSAKLAFDPSGRPGATEIREDQSRILKKQDILRSKIRKNLSPKHGCISKGVPSIDYRLSIFGMGPSLTNDKEKTQYYVGWHRIRYQKFKQKLLSEQLTRIDIEEGSPRKIFGLSLSTKSTDLPKKIGEWYYRDETDVEYDNNYYSKSWHRSYGPKKTYARSVVFGRINPTTGEVEQKTVPMSGWRGDWLVEAGVRAGILAPVKSSISLKIRLKNVYGAVLISDKMGYKIYARTLLGTTIDHAIVSPRGEIYHDNDRAKLVSGIATKMAATRVNISLPGSKLIDIGICKKLGFCNAGIESFCDDYGLDSSRSYPADFVADRVRANPVVAAKYMAELKTLAHAIDYPI